MTRGCLLPVLASIAFWAVLFGGAALGTPMTTTTWS